MGQPEETDLEIWREGDGLVARFNDADIERRQLGEFRLALLDEECAELAGVNGRVAETGNEIRNTADVVEVAVGNDQGSDTVLPLFKIFDIGQNVIYSGSIVVGKLDAGINNNDVIAEFHHRHVLADFFHATERHNTKTLSDSRDDVVGFLRRDGGVAAAAHVLGSNAGAEG